MMKLLRGYDMLLIEYLEEASAYLRERKATMDRLNEQYRRIYDRDIKHELVLVNQEIAKKIAEVTDELLLNLEEFRYLRKYFPDLLASFMEDPYVGKILMKKEWLLDFKQLPSDEATKRFKALRQWRADLRDAKAFLKTWYGKVDARSFGAAYPILRGHLKGEMDKEDVLEVIKKVDGVLLKDGWLLLITDALIKVPLTKFTSEYATARYAELQAQSDCLRVRGKGTVAEANALRKLADAQRKRDHLARVIKQILLANPNYLRSLKKGHNWLSKEKQTTLQRIAAGVTPKTVKERVWLNEMRQKLKSVS